MRRQKILGLTLIMVGCLIEAQPSIADGALAIAMPVWGDPSQGFHYSVKAGASDADTVASAVMSDCRAADNPKIGAACRLIRTFRDQCVALAVNGDAADTSVHDAPLIGAGWAIATALPQRPAQQSPSATECGNGAKKACQIMGQVRCDGTAR